VNANPPVTDPDTHHPKEGSRVMLIGLILVSVALAATAQLTLKHGMNQVTEASGTATLSAGSLRAIVTNAFVLGGLLIFGLSAVVWLMVLSRASLSFAYPFASLTYVLIVLADKLVLHEDIPVLRWAGVFAIMTGIVLVAQTPHK
jgi:drug/metabolite transporter (DMT)-like permease